MIAGVVGLHIWALHVPGNNNPLGIDVKGPQDTVPFHPYYTVKDAFYPVAVRDRVRGVRVLSRPTCFGNPDNYMPANPLVTPPDIVPEWYLLPFYAMLRSIPQKLIGVLVLFGALVTLVFMPWLDTSQVRSGRFRPLMKQFFWIFVVDCAAAGLSRLAERSTRRSRISVVPLTSGSRASRRIYYYAFFWLLMPIVGLIETPKPLPATHRQPGAGQQSRCRVRTMNMRITLGLTLAAFLGLASAAAADAVTSLPALPPSDDATGRSRARSAPYDRGAAAARLPGLQGSLLGLSQPEPRPFHNLDEAGGPGFTEAQAKAIAAGYKIPAEPNDKGETIDDKRQPLTRAGTLADHFPPPFPNEQAARAANNGGAAARSVGDRQGARRAARTMSIRS